MALSVFVPCHKQDQAQAIRLFKWIAELGLVTAPCTVVCGPDCDSTSLMAAAQQAFTSVKHVIDAENIKSNWHTNDPGPRDPTGPNSIFRQIAWHHYLSSRDPWLFLEPDAIPLTKDWYTVLESEYANCGKDCMGDLITSNSPHLSGVAVYPWDLPAKFPKMIHNVQGAFDMGCAQLVLDHAYITKRIQDVWRSASAEDFSKIRPEAVLFHCSKDGALIDLLRRKKSGVQSTNITVASGATVQMLPIDTCSTRGAFTEMCLSGKVNAPIVDIVIKSYPADYEMLNIALESIAKYATGFRKVVMIVPNGGPSAMIAALAGRLEVAIVADREPGYLWQQACKLTADQHTDADYLWFHDSDCVFTRPVDVSELFITGKPYWLKTPFDQNQARPDQQVWKLPMAKFVGRNPEYELMRRHNFLVHRSWLEKMREFCRYRHNQELSEYIMAEALPDPLSLVFSEWNCLGHFLHEFQHDLVSWVDTTKDTVPPVYIYQGFTHCSKEERNNYMGLMQQAADLIKPCQPEKTEITFGQQPIIQKLEDSITIEQAIKTLEKEAVKSPLHKARIIYRFDSALKKIKPPKAIKEQKLEKQKQKICA